MVVAAAASGAPAALWWAVLGTDDARRGLVGGFVALGCAAGAVAVVHRAVLRTLGAIGCGAMATGASLAALSIYQSPSEPLSSAAVWRAHFLIMVGSLTVAAAIGRSRRLGWFGAGGSYVLSWAFLGAWGVGLAWMAWALALRREGDGIPTIAEDGDSKAARGATRPPE